MDTIGISLPVIQQAPALAAAKIAPQAPALPAPTEKISNEPAELPTAADLYAAEHKRADAVQRASESLANSYVVSDKTFSIFKDVTGQYITRFTSLRDGKVTYIPEPELLKASSTAPDVPLLDITA